MSYHLKPRVGTKDIAVGMKLQKPVTQVIDTVNNDITRKYKCYVLWNYYRELANFSLDCQIC